MIDFLRPGTRIWIGEDLQVPAVVTRVAIVRDLTVYYTVDYWDDRDLKSIDLERYQFSTQRMTADPEYQPHDISEENRQ